MALPKRVLSLNHRIHSKILLSLLLESLKFGTLYCLLVLYQKFVKMINPGSKRPCTNVLGSKVKYKNSSCPKLLGSAA